MEKKRRQKIIRDLEAGKEYTEDSGRIYFKTLSGNIVSLSNFFERKRKLTDYFSDRPEAEKKRLVLENLAIGALPIEEDLSNIKVTCVYKSAFATCFKIEGYPESWSDKDIMFKSSLTDARGNIMEESPWRTVRNDWLWEMAKKVKREIFGSD